MLAFVVRILLLDCLGFVIYRCFGFASTLMFELFWFLFLVVVDDVCFVTPLVSGDWCVECVIFVFLLGFVDRWLNALFLDYCVRLLFRWICWSWLIVCACGCLNVVLLRVYCRFDVALCWRFDVYFGWYACYFVVVMFYGFAIVCVWFSLLTCNSLDFCLLVICRCKLVIYGIVLGCVDELIVWF